MSSFDLMDYAPIGIMFLVAIGFGISQLLVTQLIGPRKRTATKLMPYESGKDPVGSARDRFSIKFYMVAVTFLLFDLEILFMVPFAVAFKQMLIAEKATGVLYGTVAFVGIMVFLATVVIGLIYDWKKGAFEWSSQARASAKAQAIAIRKAAISKRREVGELDRAA
ncbi:MAG TPA: NADH-quinone oxidoreductase subunit A [Pyrinomonadaceae bacterium]|nr:NADH-quinone oxidoreductase subunit A [Pyrinomonadaceae bacterium]HMP64154.1 NADH-quinone oxidoreductase subunit A [Pyrinomonadaceae bacterium]